MIKIIDKERLILNLVVLNKTTNSNKINNIYIQVKIEEELERVQLK